jgi:hypothetical protein
MSKKDHLKWDEGSICNTPELINRRILINSVIKGH